MDKSLWYVCVQKEDLQSEDCLFKSDYQGQPWDQCCLLDVTKIHLLQ